MFGSRSLAEHLFRGLLGFGAFACAFIVMTHGSLWSIALALAGIALLRGCPTCWTLGLLETLSARSTQRVCQDGSCTIVHRDQPRSSAARRAAGSDVGALHEP
jgi:hypothetical protein